MRRLAAECLGTALLLAIVVGSGIMGQRLASGNDANRLFIENARGHGELIVRDILARRRASARGGKVPHGIREVRRSPGR